MHYHQGMAHRTTLTLEEDVMDRLRGEVHRTGRPLKVIVNDALRAGLEGREQRRARPFVVRARKLGLRQGLELDDIEGLLDLVEGEHRR